MTEQASAAAPFDVRRVMAALPHRFPMLLVDRVDELVPDERIVATKAVTINEPFFAGHFPDRPIMPGVLIIEAMAQAAGVLAVESLGLSGSGKLVYSWRSTGRNSVPRSNRACCFGWKSLLSRKGRRSANLPGARWLATSWPRKPVSPR